MFWILCYIFIKHIDKTVLSLYTYIVKNISINMNISVNIFILSEKIYIKLKIRQYNIKFLINN